MGQSLAHKIIAAHLIEGEMSPGQDIALRIDQCLLQDATGTMVWQQFDQLGQSLASSPALWCSMWTTT